MFFLFFFGHSNEARSSWNINAGEWKPGVGEEGPGDRLGSPFLAMTANLVRGVLNMVLFTLI